MSVLEKSIDELLKVSYSHDRLRAHVILGEGINQSEISPNFLKQKLKDHGIIFGIKEDLFQREETSFPLGEQVLIAEGVPAIDGKDGWVEYLFEKYKQDGVMEEKKYPVHNIRKGEMIAVVYPPEDGKPGKTVRGEIIETKPGKHAVLHPGKYTSFLEESKNKIIATEDGYVIMHKNGSVEVQPELVIQGNYDAQMGLLDFVGSVVINGDINPGVIMKIGKNLIVKGTIRDADIDTGEAVIVEGGFIGKGEGRIQSEGSVKLKHVWHQQIIAKGDIEVKREIVGGRLSTSGNIIASDATMSGGLLEAERDIIIKNLGCGDSSQGRVRAGVHSGILERLEKVTGEIKQLHKQTEEIDKVIYKLVTKKIEVGSLPDEEEERLRKLKFVKKLLPQQIEAVHGEKKSLQHRLEQRREVRIKVEGRVQENVIININGVTKIIQSEVEGAEFLERNGSIEIRAL